jgi:thiamine biosynthesis lipoprotein
VLTRRRFLKIAAALAPLPGLATTLPHVETGIALGARVTLHLDHPEAPRLAALAMAEIRRLEAVFSLYQPDSALCRLNRDGRLPDPPLELLGCLTLAGAVHAATGGRFDPTVQPLWRAEAQATERGIPLTEVERAAARAVIDWSGVSLSPEEISLRPGMALTLNGIAQGAIADRVAALLADHGLTHALIDTGEMVAMPGVDWPVALPDRDIGLRGRALATSAPFGMTFGGDGVTSHILDPEHGHPVRSAWRSITVSAHSAALADALSTALCLTKVKEQAQELCKAFDGVTLDSAIPL